MALDTNLKGYWKLNETSGSSAEDYVLSNNGTLQASSTFSASGKLNYCFYTSADSSTAGIDLGTKSNLDISQYPLSVSAWFKTSSAFTQENSNMVIFSNVKGSSNYSGFHLDMVMGSTTGDRGKIQFTYRNNAGTDYTLTTTATYNDGNFHHVVATISSGGAMVIYVDGSSVASGTTATSTLYTGTKKATIGTNWDVNANGVWVGYLDEVIFWDREVTSSEVTELYNSGTGKEFYTIQTSYLGSNDDYENGGTSANRAQSFQFQTYDASLTGVGFYGSKGNLSSGTFKFVLRSGSASGTEVATTGTINSSTLTAYGSPAWNNIPFTTPYTATKDTTYWLVMICLTGSTNDEVRWSTDTTSPSYSYGSRYYATSGDTGWTEDTTRDYNFRIYGTSSAASGPAAVKTVNGLAIASVKTKNGLAIASVKNINGLA